MYNKIFTKILDSSIWSESVTTRIVWVTFLAAMDEDGFVQFAGLDNVKNRARVTLKQATEAVAILESPDKDSADPDNDGRRIERVAGGWMVLNSQKYREMVTRVVVREQTRLRVKKHRERKRNADVTPRNENETPSEAIAEAEADTRGVVVKAETTATPDGTPVNFAECFEPTATAPRKLTPKDLGIQINPAVFAQVQLAHDLAALVSIEASTRIPGRPITDVRLTALDLLHDVSTTPAGKRIETLDLRRVPSAWCAVSSHAARKLALEAYGVELDTAFERPDVIPRREPAITRQTQTQEIP